MDMTRKNVQNPQSFIFWYTHQISSLLEISLSVVSAYIQIFISTDLDLTVPCITLHLPVTIKW